MNFNIFVCSPAQRWANTQLLMRHCLNIICMRLGASNAVCLQWLQGWIDQEPMKTWTLFKELVSKFAVNLSKFVSDSDHKDNFALIDATGGSTCSSFKWAYQKSLSIFQLKFLVLKHITPEHITRSLLYEISSSKRCWNTTRENFILLHSAPPNPGLHQRVVEKNKEIADYNIFIYFSWKEVRY